MCHESRKGGGGKVEKRVKLEDRRWNFRKLVLAEFHPQIRVRASKTLTSGGLSNYGGVSRSGYRANAVGSGRRAVLESAPRVGGFAVRGKPPALEPLLSVIPPAPHSSPCPSNTFFPGLASLSDFLVNFPPVQFEKEILRPSRKARNYESEEKSLGD